MRMERRFGVMGAAALLLMAAPLMAGLLMAGCGADDGEAEVPEVAAGSEPSAVLIDSTGAPIAQLAAQHGGTVVLAGDQHVEVLASDDGTVDAYVITPEPPSPDQTRITVRVPADDGSVHPVMLTWDPSEGRYRGRLRQVHPVPGPVEVVIVVGGAEQRGSVPQIVLFGPSGPISGPRVVVQNAPSQGPDVDVIEVEAPSQPQFIVQPPRPGVIVVERPAPPRGPTVVVTHPMPPRPTVVVNAPAPPQPRVVVHAPAPPQPRVVVHAPAPPRPRVVVHAPGPPQPTVVVRQPAPRVVVQRPSARVEVRRPGATVRVHSDNGQHRGHEERGGGHGRGRGH